MITASSTLLTVAAFGAVTATASAQFWQPIDFSPHYNFSWQGIGGGMVNAPSGCTSLRGVPFSLGLPSQDNAWYAERASGPNPRTIDIQTALSGVIEVHLLINTFWGQRGPGSYLAVEFFGVRGAYYRKSLIGDVDIRDFNQNAWTNSINGTTTVNVWATLGSGLQRLDKQRVVLPQSFSTDTLQTIRLIDTGGANFQRAVLYGVTAGLAAPPCLADCDQSTCVGALDILDFLCFQNRFAQNDPYACDFDTSTGPGVCDIFDFLAFQNAFTAGCR